MSGPAKDAEEVQEIARPAEQTVAKPAIDPTLADSEDEVATDGHDFPETFATPKGCLSGETKGKALLAAEQFCADDKDNRKAAQGLPTLSKTLAQMPCMRDAKLRDSQKGAEGKLVSGTDSYSD